MQRGTSLMNKLAGKPKYEDEKGNRQWIHPEKTLIENFVVYQAKYIGCTDVSAPRGIEVVKDAIKKIQFAHELKKSEAGKKGSKLVKVEVWISIDVIKVINSKTKEVLAQKPLHRISYCADDHNDKKLFSFIAKEQETKSHLCYAFFTEREAAELTVTVGQSFELAYKRYLQKGKQGSKENKEIENLKKQIEDAKAENAQLKKKLDGPREQQPQQPQQPAQMLRRQSNGSSNSQASQNSMPSAMQQAEPSLLFDFGAAQQQPPPETFDPFDAYISNLSSKRGLGAAETPEHLQDRAPFQSPVQKNPADNPFNETPTKSPFDAFFSGGDSPSVAENGSERQPATVDYTSQPASTTTATAAQFLPPPPSKQSIKAANAMKMKPATKVQNPAPAPAATNGGIVQNGGAPADPFSEGLFGSEPQRDPSMASLEQTFGAGLQFDAYSFDPLQ